MKITLTLILFVSTHFLYAQYAYISDPDGYVNVRSGSEKTNNIIHKLYNGDFVYYYEQEGDWVSVGYITEGDISGGYIHYSRLVKLSSLSKIPVISELTNKIVFKNADYEISIQDEPFVKEKHSIQYENSQSNFVATIDNKHIWGTDGNIPKRQYKSIELKYANEKYNIPSFALKNLFEPNLSALHVNVYKNKNRIYIQAYNSDGAGGYAILFIIENNIYKDRIIMHGF